MINPLEIPYHSRKNIVVHTQNFANAIEETIWAEFSVNMGALLIPCITLLLYKRNSDLTHLIRLMQDDPELIEEGKKLPIPAHRMIFENFHDPLYARTKASIFTKLQSFINYPAFYNATVWQSTINIRKSINTGKILVFNLSPRLFCVEASQAFGRFIIALIKSTISMRWEYRKPTYLFVDECQHFLSPSFESIL